MSYIKVRNKVITTPLEDILKQLKFESGNRYFKSIKVKNDEIMFTCPFHKDGQENHPSCSIHDNVLDEQHGVFNCFTCHSAGDIIDLISFCLKLDRTDAEEWLIERCSTSFLRDEIILPEIKLENEKNDIYLDENILYDYSYFHPYMFERGLTEEVIRKYKIGCTENGEYLTFPCWDEHNHLVGIYKRSTKTKEFIIPKNIKKCVYLLNFLINEHKNVAYITEGQFDALTLCKWGYPAVALFGTGTQEQYNILKKSGIRNYILCFDGDKAGMSGAKRFVKNMNQNCFITIKQLPNGKDINDLTKEEFENLNELVDF